MRAPAPGPSARAGAASLAPSSAAAESQGIYSGAERRGPGELARRPRRSQVRFSLLRSRGTHCESCVPCPFQSSEGRSCAALSARVHANCQGSDTLSCDLHGGTERLPVAQVRFSTLAVSEVGAAAATPARTAGAGSGSGSNAGSTPFPADRHAARTMPRERASAARLYFNDAAAAQGSGGRPDEGFGGSVAQAQRAPAPQLRSSDTPAAEGFVESHDEGPGAQLRTSVHTAEGYGGAAGGRGGAPEGGIGRLPAAGTPDLELVEAVEVGAKEPRKHSGAALLPGELSPALLAPALLDSVHRMHAQPPRRTLGPRSVNPPS